MTDEDSPTRDRLRGAVVTAAKGVSWMSLVAATTLGVGEVDEVRATVLSDEELNGGDYRLVVQSYDKNSLEGGLVPAERARPRASLQRAVTAEELRRGVEVNMLHLESVSSDDSIVVAWVERGLPNLELDALTARPSVGAYYGVASLADPTHATIVLASG